MTSDIAGLTLNGGATIAFNVNNPTQVSTFVFYLRIEYENGIVLESTNMKTMLVNCGPSSTTVTAPAILSVEPGTDYYLIHQSSVDNLYPYPSFTSSNANCPMDTLSI